MLWKNNYEYVSLHVKSQKTRDLVYKIKDYLNQIMVYCDIRTFNITGDEVSLNHFDHLEDYEIITYEISYHTYNKNFGEKFYTKNCVEIPISEVHVFGIMQKDFPVFYEYNGWRISRIETEAMVDLEEYYNYFEAKPLSLLFYIPIRQTINEFEALLKKWVEIGNKSFEVCTKKADYKQYRSYLVEIVCQINRENFCEMVNIYHKLVRYVYTYCGNILMIQPYLISKYGNHLVVISFEKRGVGVFYPEPPFKKLNEL